MDIKDAIKKQHHATYAMLRQAIEQCPDSLWNTPDGPRAFWRIAYHALFYGHLYLYEKKDDYVYWELHRDKNADLYADQWEPGKGPLPYTKTEMLSYCDLCDGMVDASIDGMDMDSPESGYPWYDCSKLEHMFISLRHLSLHTGQLSELLLAHDIETEWIGVPAMA